MYEIGSVVKLKCDFQTETILIPQNTEVKIIQILQNNYIIAQLNSNFSISTHIDNLKNIN